MKERDLFLILFAPQCVFLFLQYSPYSSCYIQNPFTSREPLNLRAPDILCPPDTLHLCIYLPSETTKQCDSLKKLTGNLFFV